MATAVLAQHGIGATETGRRIWAIVGGSSGNLVEWLLHLHHLHAEISGQHGRDGCQDCESGHDRSAVLLHAVAACVRGDFGQDRPPQFDAVLRRVHGAYYRADLKRSRMSRTLTPRSVW